MGEKRQNVRPDPFLYERVEVECYSGYKANERPVAFTYRGVRYDIAAIVDRWYEGGIEPGRPQLDYFKVRSSDGQEFFLRYSALFDAWSLGVTY